MKESNKQKAERLKREAASQEVIQATKTPHVNNKPVIDAVKVSSGPHRSEWMVPSPRPRINKWYWVGVVVFVLVVTFL